jgi:serine/threonine protein kinase
MASNVSDDKPLSGKPHSNRRGHSRKLSLIEHYKTKRFNSPGRIQRGKLPIQRSHNGIPGKMHFNLDIDKCKKLGTEESRQTASAPELDNQVYYNGKPITILGEVGQGSYSTVYKAESPISSPRTSPRYLSDDTEFEMGEVIAGGEYNSIVKSRSECDVDINTDTDRDDDGDDGDDDDLTKTEDEIETVVVKVCTNDGSWQTQKDIAAEKAMLLSSSDSPYIVKCFGLVTNTDVIGANNSNVGFLLEYCKNGSLNQFLIKNADELILSKENIISFVQDIAKAVNFVHSLGVIHRDIRSPNFLVTENLRLKLCDFGLARKDTAFNKDTTLKKIKTNPNPRWNAPELYDDVCDTSVGSYTFASDIYSTAIVIWEVFNYWIHNKYSVPFGTRKHPYKIMKEIVDGCRPDITNDDFPGQWKTILTKTWNQNPKLRPSSTKLLDVVCGLN